jgi:hypothetical protein
MEFMFIMKLSMDVMPLLRYLIVHTDENVNELVLTNRRITICKVAANFIWIISEYLERQSEHASEYCQIHALPAE